MVVDHDRVLGNKKCRFNKKKEQRVYQGLQSGADSAPEDQWGYLCLIQVLQELTASQYCKTTLYLPSATCFGGKGYHQRDGAPPRYHTDEKIFSVLIFKEDKK